MQAGRLDDVPQHDLGHRSLVCDRHVEGHHTAATLDERDNRTHVLSVALLAATLRRRSAGTVNAAIVGLVRLNDLALTA